MAGWDCGLLALVAGCTNGALTQLYGDSPTPLSYWNLNTNYAQTRKSEINKMMSTGIKILDSLIEHEFLEKWQDAVTLAEMEADDAGREWKTPERPIVQSIEIPSCTPEDFLYRVSSDWPQVSNAKDTLPLIDEYAKAKQCKAMQSKAMQSKSMQSKGKQCKSKAKQCKVKKCKANHTQ